MLYSTRTLSPDNGYDSGNNRYYDVTKDTGVSEFQAYVKVIYIPQILHEARISNKCGVNDHGYTGGSWD